MFYVIKQFCSKKINSEIDYNNIVDFIITHLKN